MRTSNGNSAACPEVTPNTAQLDSRSLVPEQDFKPTLLQPAKSGSLTDIACLTKAEFSVTMSDLAHHYHHSGIGGY